MPRMLRLTLAQRTLIHGRALKYAHSSLHMQLNDWKIDRSDNDDVDDDDDGGGYKLFEGRRYMAAIV
jgi:hypothetical protein